MSKVFGLLPTTTAALTNNVINTTINSTTANIFDIKIDHNISYKQRISGGFDLRQYKHRAATQTSGPYSARPFRRTLDMCVSATTTFSIQQW